MRHLGPSTHDAGTRQQKTGANHPGINTLPSRASQGEVHFGGESQEQVHGYLETDFVSPCLVAEIFASPIAKNRVSVVKGPVGGESGQEPASKGQESRL